MAHVIEGACLPVHNSNWAALGPVLREYLIGESMHALGIPTTRALAAVAVGVGAGAAAVATASGVVMGAVGATAVTSTTSGSGW